MKSMTTTLEQLRKEKDALDETITALEQLSRKLERARTTGDETKAAPAGTRPNKGRSGRKKRQRGETRQPDGMAI